VRITPQNFPPGPGESSSDVVIDELGRKGGREGGGVRGIYECMYVCHARSKPLPPTLPPSLPPYLDVVVAFSSHRAHASLAHVHGLFRKRCFSVSDLVTLPCIRPSLPPLLKNGRLTSSTVEATRSAEGRGAWTITKVTCASPSPKASAGRRRVLPRGRTGTSRLSSW